MYLWTNHEVNPLQDQSAYQLKYLLLKLDHMIKNIIYNALLSILFKYTTGKCYKLTSTQIEMFLFFWEVFNYVNNMSSLQKVLYFNVNLLGLLLWTVDSTTWAEVIDQKQSSSSYLHQGDHNICSNHLLITLHHTFVFNYKEQFHWFIKWSHYQLKFDF